jgi:DNA-binding PadR family transcriptional regulator
MTLHVAKPRELVELVVLGLLCERPRHPYDMQRELKQRGNTSFVRGLPRSLSHAVDSLVEQGYVHAGETSRDGTRPERTTYDATVRGREAFVARLTHLLETPTDQPTYHAALSLVAGLTKDQTVAALERRIEALDAELEVATARITDALEWLPRLVLIEVEYLQSQLRAEQDWTRAIVAEARSGALSWNLKFKGRPPTR